MITHKISAATADTWVIAGADERWVLTSTGSITVDDTAISVDANQIWSTILLAGAIDADGSGTIGIDSGTNLTMKIFGSSTIHADTGFHFYGGRFTLVNRGAIDASGVGIDSDSPADSSLLSSVVTNHGLIRGDTAAIQDGDGNFTIYNERHATIDGDVRLGGGNDALLLESGSITTGKINMGDGIDHVVVLKHAILDKALSGGDGDDLYDIYTHSQVTIKEDQDGGTDTIHVLHNYTLPDNVEYLAVGGKPGVVGTGNDLDNVMWADDRRIHLDGGDGNDVLIHDLGRGHSFFFGGAGDDLFVLQTGGPEKAWVEDFTQGEDKIALPGIGLEDVVWQQDGADTLIGINDVGGHLYAEMRLRNFDSTALTADDFLQHFSGPGRPV